MPPAKVKIERIASDRTRQNTFHKRKLGLIKKAIELSVLTDCDCAIILRSAPTATCPDGKLSAYCNKDLEQMITEYISQPASEYYTNAEYARFTKDCDVVRALSSSPQDCCSSIPAIEVDGETGMDEDCRDRSTDGNEVLRQQMASMEAELLRLRSCMGSDSTFVPTSAPPSSSFFSPLDAAAVAEEHVGKKRSPPLTSFGGEQQETFAVERDNKKRCSHEEGAESVGAGSDVYGVLGGVMREASWDFSSFLASTPTHMQPSSLLSPCKGFATPRFNAFSGAPSQPLSFGPLLRA